MRLRPGFKKVRLLAAAALVIARAFPAFSGQPCVGCHPREVQGFMATPMGHSLGPPGRGPSGTFYHSLSGTRFTIRSGSDHMTQRMERDGLASQYSIAYSLGSGAHAVAYVIDVGNHLFESPLSYYAAFGWGMSPGYENLKAPDFYRAVRPQCLFCHVGEARPIAGTLNAYRNPPFAAEAINCERCHGPATAHLRNPVPGSIINPAKLPPRARDSVCEQCHLDGEVGIPNPGKQITDFHAGENLEDVYTVYVYQSSRSPAHPNALTIISQSQQLALSQCARKSGDRLWCGTCHDPHALPKNPVAYFRARCLNCHGGALLASHPKPNQNCLGCHMPRLPAGHGAHTIFTDHRIAVYTLRELAELRAPSLLNGSAPATNEDELVPWHNPSPQFAERSLGLAYVRVGTQLESFPFVRRGYELLLSASSKFPNDPVLLRAMAKVISGTKAEADAEALFEKVLAVEPNSALVYDDMAFAAETAGDNENAIKYLEKTLELDPLLVDPYKHLARLYAVNHQLALAHQTYVRFLKAFPENIEAKRGVLRSSEGLHTDKVRPKAPRSRP
ncbi:MAG: tetratricopeptide repeat protein [Bryobacteraceae bacterium]